MKLAEQARLTRDMGSTTVCVRRDGSFNALQALPGWWAVNAGRLICPVSGEHVRNGDRHISNLNGMPEAI